MVDIQIVNPSGLGGVLHEGFTYVGPMPAPTVSSLEPGVGPASGGTRVTVTGTDFVSGAGVKFGGVAATDVVVINSKTLICTTPASAVGPSTLTVVNPDGQSAQKENAFTFVAPPQVTAIAPASGSTNGGTVLTLDGTGFRAGAEVTIGGTPATAVTVASATRITATTPAHAAATVDVIVRNDDGQTSTLAGSYTYVPPPPPTVASISPSAGVSTGGTSVTLTGTGFVEGVSVKLGGVSATSVVFVSATQLTAVTGAHAVGAVNVDVRNPDGSAGTLTGGYTYEPVPAPTLTGLSPAHGTTSGGTTVTVTGTNFRSGVEVLFGGVSGTVGSVSATSITVSTPVRASIGAVDVVVRNADMQTATATGGFTYDWGAAPGISSVSPTHGSVAGGTSISLVGNGFVAGATVTVGGVAATSVNVVGTSRINAVTTARAAGLVDIVVKNTDNQVGTLTRGYTYDPLPVATVSSVSPSQGPSAGGTSVTIFGSNFVNGAAVKFGTVDAASVTLGGSSLLTAVSPAQAPGLVGITVTNPGTTGTTLANAYTYNPAPAPTVSALTPSSGPTTGGTSVTLHGTGFVSGVTVTFDGKAATQVTFGSSTSITATPPAHAAGAVAVVVTNPDAQKATLAGGFTYLAPPAPSVTSISPDSGPSTGGTSVTINGTSFVDGATVKFGALAATSVTFGSGTSLVAIAPAQAAGKVAVTVLLPDGQEGSLSNAYTYVDAPGITLASVNPSTGTTQGSTDVTLTGTGFASGATVTFGGEAATDVRVASGSSISARTPAHVAGDVDVKVRNPDGKEALLTHGFTYVRAPAPTISAVSPNVGSTEGGQRVSLTGTNFVAGTGVRFGGTEATQVSMASATSITATAPAMSAGTVTVTVILPDGQGGSLANGFTYQAPVVLTPTAPEPSKGGCSTGGPEMSLLALMAVGARLGRRLSGKRPS